MNIIQPLIAAFLNRARGSQCFGFVPYTSITRILTSIGFAATFSQSWLCFVLLIIAFLNWEVWAWDIYWATASGCNNKQTAPAFKPADWILSKLPVQPGSRMWGIVGMGLRQGLTAIPIFLILAYFTQNLIYLPLACVPFLFGLPYFVTSYVTKYFIPVSETLIGAFWGILLGT